MSNLAIVNPDDQNDLDSLSPTERRERLKSAFTMSVNGILKAAEVIASMGRCGDDLSDLGISQWLTFLRRVGSGELLPEVLTRYMIGPSQHLLSKVSRLIIGDQKTVVSAKPIKVVEHDGKGYTSRLILAENMSPEQIRQVFATDHIRDEPEQVTWLEREKKKRIRVRDVVHGVRIDAERQVAIFTRGEKTEAQLREIASELALARRTK
jgi:hypothetical protein